MNKKLGYFALFLTICGINILNDMFPFFNLVFLIPIIFLFFFISNIKSLTINILILPILFLTVWGFIPSILAESSINAAFASHRGFIFVLIYIFIIYWYAKQSTENIMHIFDFHIATFIIAIAYVFGSQEIIDFQSTSRLKSDITGQYLINANSIGYLAFTAIISSVSKFIYNQNKTNLLLVITIFLISIISVTLSASRSGIIVVLLLATQFYFYLNRNLTKNNFTNFILATTLIMITILLFLPLFFSFFENTFLFYRFDENIFSDMRYLHIVESVSIILENPIFGVGPGNYQLINSFELDGTFSHNTFTEVTLSYGIIGLFAYLNFIYNIFNVKNNSNKLSFLKFLFIPSFLIYNFFYVIYLSPLFMGITINLFLFLQKNVEQNNSYV